METILKNIEEDIKKVQGYIERLRKSQTLSPKAARAVLVYEDMLLQLLQQSAEVKEYIKEVNR